MKKFFMHTHLCHGLVNSRESRAADDDMLAFLVESNILFDYEFV